jgi:hypothetical protein
MVMKDAIGAVTPAGDRELQFGQHDKPQNKSPTDRSMIEYRPNDGFVKGSSVVSLARTARDR